MLYGLDVSSFQGDMNYLSTDIYRRSDFIIAQAYRHINPGGTERQLRQAKADGKLITAYTFLWHGRSYRTADKTVEGDMRSRLAAIPDNLPLDGRLWLDLEDDVSPDWGGTGLATRRDEVQRALAAMREWSEARGLPEPGIYTSPYYVDRLYSGWYPQGVPLWLAHYGIEAGSPVGTTRYGAPVVGHQYTSTPLDQNLFLDSEFNREGEVPAIDYVPQEYRDKFGATHPDEVYANLEGIISMLIDRLDRVKEIVNA